MALLSGAAGPGTCLYPAQELLHSRGIMCVEATQLLQEQPVSLLPLSLHGHVQRWNGHIPLLQLNDLSGPKSTGQLGTCSHAPLPGTLIDDFEHSCAGILGG